MKQCLMVFVFFWAVLPRLWAGESKSWFSQPVVLRDARLFYQLAIRDSSFRLLELSFHPLRGWQEIRYQGNWYQQKSTKILQARYCKEYSSPHLQKKWILTAVFDCEHLHFQVNEQAGKLIISPGFFGDAATKLHIINGPPNKLAALVVYHSPNYTFVWRNRFFRIPAGSMGYANRKTRPILQSLESVGLISPTPELAIGQLLWIQPIPKEE